jgi:hypothetical protein
MRPSAPSSAAGAFLRPALTATMQCENGNSKIVISYGGLKGGEGFLTNPARCVQAFAGATINPLWRRDSFWSGSHVEHAIPPRQPTIGQKRKTPASIGPSDEH